LLDPRRFRPASRCNRADARQRNKTAACKVTLNVLVIVIAVRRAGQKARRVLGKDGFECGDHGVGEFVFLDPVPHVKNENTSPPEHPPCFRKRFRPFRKEHGPELTHDRVKTCVRKRQLHGICLPPLHWTRGPDR